jgi:hypothetical protein
MLLIFLVHEGSGEGDDPVGDVDPDREQQHILPHGPPLPALPKVRSTCQTNITNKFQKNNLLL